MFRYSFIFILLTILQHVHPKGPFSMPKRYVSRDCECGQKPEGMQTRIVGGSEAVEHSHPWIAGVLKAGKLFCAGSLINDRYVLTAAHCLHGKHERIITVALGMHDKDNQTKPQQGVVIYSVSKLKVYEFYYKGEEVDEEDIGLILLKKRVKFSKDISTICLPMPGYQRTGKTAKILGWGRLSERGERPKLLQEATVQVINNQDCLKHPFVGPRITTSVICAYGNKVDACQGDSGGPMIWESRNRTEQIGVVSWGVGCARPRMPGVYTDVSKFLDWILYHTRDAIYCTDPRIDSKSFYSSRRKKN